MKILFIIAFVSVAISILLLKFSPDTVGRSIAHIVPAVALSSLYIFFGYHAVWTWSLERAIPASQSHNWPTVDGKIIQSSIREESGKNNTHTYYPDIKYVYDVKGQRFEGHNVMYEQNGPPVFQRETVATALKSLQAGQTVKVFYDSHNPQKSCLQPGFYENPAAHVLMIFIGVYMLISAMMALWKDVRWANRESMA